MNPRLKRIMDGFTPPAELVQHYEVDYGLPHNKAVFNARRLWERINRIENFRDCTRDLYEAVKRRAEMTGGDVSNLAQWNKLAMDQMMIAEDARIITTLTEMIRRANGHDASTIKHMKELPDIETVKKWKQEMIEAGMVRIEDFAGAAGAKQIEAKVVTPEAKDAAVAGNR